MKKTFLFTSIVILAVICAVLLCGCGQKNMYFFPEVVSEIEEFQIKHVNNMQKDYIFPTGEKLDHSLYTEQNITQSAYLITNSAGELLGWINMGFAYGNDGEYGFGADTSNDMPMHFYDQSISVYLLTSDKNVFSHLNMTANYGSINFIDTFEPAFKEGVEKVALVGGIYDYKLSQVDPTKISDAIKITITKSN